MVSDYKGEGSALAAAFEGELEMIRVCKAELETLPEGSLYLDPVKGKIYFQHAFQGKRKSIGRNQELVYQLARKKFLKLKVRAMEERLDCLCRGRKPGGHYEGKMRTLLRRYKDAGLEIMRVTCSEKQYRWAKEKYRKNPIPIGERVYKTSSGIDTRSKSERDIGNKLELMGIPYRYDAEIQLNVAWMEGIEGASFNGYKRYYADFTIPAAAGHCIYWEHLGRVDLKDYRRRNAEKLFAMRQTGFCGEHQLVLTFEKDMEDQRVLKKIIEQRVLPYV